uniref:Uncharacterized protein n=1 Tax=Colobus angolensis palliatus TaxID=336983 RepID=A0A2K5JU04_COLAP
IMSQEAGLCRPHDATASGKCKCMHGESSAARRITSPGEGFTRKGL